METSSTKANQREKHRFKIVWKLVPPKQIKERNIKSKMGAEYY